MTLHMKMRMKSKSTKKIIVKEPLYYDQFEYYIKLSVGTPPQHLFLVMDTGSDVVWAPCTRNYRCNYDCGGYGRVFLPRKSSSHVPIKCADPKCRDLCDNEGCVESFQKCSGICPHFNLRYGSGNATGRLLSDTLTLPLENGGRREIKHFAIGCSVVSSGSSGIAGFGRGGLSMPSQLAPLIGDKFAYCLDHANNGSKIVLGNKAVPRDIPLTWTPLFINPVNPSDSTFYYLGLQAVSIGVKRLTLPSNLTTFDGQGNGGTIIDSGTSVTHFPHSIYKQIVGVFGSQIRYRRSPRYEVDTRLGLCYNVSGVQYIRWPKFAFHFNGGSQMVLPDENAFIYVSDDVFCLAMLNGGIAVNGPAVLIGNFQQNNFYILYDREKNRLGFTQRACKTFG